MIIYKQLGQFVVQELYKMHFSVYLAMSDHLDYFLKLARRSMNLYLKTFYIRGQAIYNVEIRDPDT